MKKGKEKIKKRILIYRKFYTRNKKQIFCFFWSLLKRDKEEEGRVVERRGKSS